MGSKLSHLLLDTFPFFSVYFRVVREAIELFACIELCPSQWSRLLQTAVAVVCCRRNALHFGRGKHRTLGFNESTAVRQSLDTLEQDSHGKYKGPIFPTTTAGIQEMFEKIQEAPANN